MDEEERQDQRRGGYNKRPLWQWIIIYLIIGAIIYGLIYYFIIARGTPSPVPGY